MSEHSAGPETTVDELLVAYLDGELDASSARRLEARLAAEPDLRHRLRQLDRPWRMLDELSAEPVDKRFTHATLEMIATTAAGDAENPPVATWRMRRRWFAAGGLLGAAVAGFLMVALLRPDPNRQIAEDLPVLENFDAYRQVESIEFLRALRDERLFQQE